MESDRTRQVVAAIVGIIVIVLLVLFARWTGDRIRERFLTPKPTEVTQSQPVTVTETLTPQEQTLPAASYSAIPSTGPADLGYYLLGFLFLAGASVSALAKRAS